MSHKCFFFFYKTSVLGSDCFFCSCVFIFLPVAVVFRAGLFSPSLPATLLSCIIFIWIILGLFQDRFSSIPPVYADGGTDHSDSCTALAYQSCWARRIRPDLAHFTTPMHIPSRCTRAIVNRVSLYRRGTVRVEILARFVLRTQKVFQTEFRCVSFSLSAKCAWDCIIVLLRCLQDHPQHPAYPKRQLRSGSANLYIPLL